ncbi:isocitrate lyase/PEP mutase family protein [Nocardia transvalensis]|uniref:isocitrate lyase/PEP mutase family protein n=1 Tax=Nocardia transvalensis TaxID=37333 RepID=UPI001E4FE18F|nr:isocitrate lyase/phosphoenolpyruvate mutase family protein [Nocardia transvalensis]
MTAIGETELFRCLHRGEQPLVLPNAWDYCSGAALVAAGFPAVGTTSLGVAAAAGRPDAAGATKDETLSLARRLVRLPVPVTVDIEGGFGTDPAEVADFADTLAALGVAGINIEDGRPGGTLADPAHHAELVAAIKARTPEVFVNARVDTYWLNIDHDSTLDRAEQYRSAGADGIFVPGLREPDDIRRVVAAIPLPLNVLSLPGGPSVAQLGALGVRRVSTGGLLFRAAIAAAVGTARAVRAGRPSPNVPSYADIQALIDDPRRRWCQDASGSTSVNTSGDEVATPNGEISLRIE